MASALSPQATEIAAVRGLDLRRPVAVSDVTRARFRRVLHEQAAREPLDTSQGAFFSAFGFAPAGVQVSREATVQASLDALLGLYVPRDRAVYLRPRAHPRAGERPEEILIHELVHAAQDDHFGFAKMEDTRDVPEDELLARRAVYEGDATVSTWLVLGAREGLDREHAIRKHLYGARAASLMAEGSQEMELGPAVTPVVRAEMSFPYSAGAYFVGEAVRAGGFDLVAKVFARLPTTTEQVLHPEKYFAGEGAIPVATPSAPAGWSIVTHGRLGELRTRAFLATTLPAERALPASTGWGGDAYVVLARQGALAVRWSTIWDDEPSAQRFAAALTSATACASDSCPTVSIRREGARVAFSRGLARGEDDLAALLRLPGAVPALAPPCGPVVLAEARAETPVIFPPDDPTVTLAPLGLRFTVPPSYGEIPSDTQDFAMRNGANHGHGSLSRVAGPFDATKEAAMKSAFTAIWAGSFEVEPAVAADVDLPIGRGRDLAWRFDHGRGRVHVTFVPMCGGAQVLLAIRIARTEESRVALAQWLQSIEPIAPGLAAVCSGPAPDP